MVQHTWDEAYTGRAILWGLPKERAVSFGDKPFPGCPSLLLYITKLCKWQVTHFLYNCVLISVNWGETNRLNCCQGKTKGLLSLPPLLDVTFTKAAISWDCITIILCVSFRVPVYTGIGSWILDSVSNVWLCLPKETCSLGLIPTSTLSHLLTSCLRLPAIRKLYIANSSLFLMYIFDIFIIIF